MRVEGMALTLRPTHDSAARLRASTIPCSSNSVTTASCGRSLAMSRALMRSSWVEAATTPAGRPRGRARRGRARARTRGTRVRSSDPRYRARFSPGPRGSSGGRPPRARCRARWTGVTAPRCARERRKRSRLRKRCDSSCFPMAESIESLRAASAGRTLTERERPMSRASTVPTWSSTRLAMRRASSSASRSASSRRIRLAECAWNTEKRSGGSAAAITSSSRRTGTLSPVRRDGPLDAGAPRREARWATRRGWLVHHAGRSIGGRRNAGPWPRFILWHADRHRRHGRRRKEHPHPRARGPVRAAASRWRAWTTRTHGSRGSTPVAPTRCASTRCSSSCTSSPPASRACDACAAPAGAGCSTAPGTRTPRSSRAGYFEQGVMTPAEWELYRRLYVELLHSPAARPPRLMVYLHAPLDDDRRRASAPRARRRRRTPPDVLGGAARAVRAVDRRLSPVPRARARRARLRPRRRPAAIETIAARVRARLEPAHAADGALSARRGRAHLTSGASPAGGSLDPAAGGGRPDQRGPGWVVRPDSRCMARHPPGDFPGA